MSDCILGIGTVDSTGYVRERRFGRLYGAHRLAYSDAYGGIPTGFHIHHLCGNKQCVNPEHLEALNPVMHGAIHTNPNSLKAIAARTTCKRGHPLDGRRAKGRYCLKCHRQVSNKYYHQLARAQLDKRNARRRELRALQNG